MTQFTAKQRILPAQQQLTRAAVTLRALEEIQSGPGLNAEQVALMVICKEELGLPVSYRTYTTQILDLISALKGGQ